MTESACRIFTKKKLSIIILVGIFIWVAIYIRNHIQEFKDIKLPSWEDIVILLPLSFLGVFLSGLFTKLLVEHFGISLRFKQWFGIMAVTSLGNYLFPFSGFGLRATYLKKFHNFPYAYFLSTMLATYIIRFLIYSILGLICLVLIYLNSDFFSLSLFILLLSVTLVCLVAVLFTPKLPAMNNKFFRHLSRIMDGWLQLKKSKLLILKLTAVLLSGAFVFAAVVYFAFSAFDYQLPLFEILLISSLVSFTVLLRFTPGSFGIQEGAFVFSAQLFGITVAQGLMVAGLVRVAYLIWVFTLGPLFGYLLMNESKFEKG
ncbi:MAG: flippase-like domain-containing protein [Anaerohalosphaeraceae bacterium]|nr:flippase-like domain-containing protein [Anaerohalosphaeraceae bacterium]